MIRKLTAPVFLFPLLGGPSLALQTGGFPNNDPAYYPNVLVIVLDDLGTDKLSFYDLTDPTCATGPCTGPADCTSLPTGCVDPYPATPNLDQLRQQGILFSRAYSMPLCSPTRACIQTGRYPLRTGVGHLTHSLEHPDIYELPSDEVFLPELVRDGLATAPIGPGLPYFSGAFGKWHLSSSLQANWGHAVENGFHRFYGTMGNVENYFDWEKIEHDKGSAPQSQQIDGTTSGYTAATWNASVTRADAAEWIMEQTNSFLAYVNFNPPHLPLQVPPLELLSPEMQCRLDCEQLTAGDIVANTDAEERRLLVFAAMIEAIDHEIGALLDEIQPKLADTMIFVVGDNGTPGVAIDSDAHDTSHGKHTVYEWGVRVPLIVSGPLVKSPVPSGGWVNDTAVSVVDLFRTIADVTGASVSQAGPILPLDSRSLFPLIEDPTAPSNRPPAFAQIFTPAGIVPWPPVNNQSCLKRNERITTDGHYKYVRVEIGNLNPCPHPVNYFELLFDVAGDPEETVDLLHPPTTDPVALAARDLLSDEMDTVSGP